MPSADLLLHPVRLRIVQAFLGDRTLTTAELRTELADVPVASLYRHVGLLTGAGVLVVAGERQARGAVERSYRLDLTAASLASEDVASMSADDHRRAFRTFAAALLADFDRYVDRTDGAPDLARDRVGYRQAALWLTDEEFDALAADLAEVLRDRLGNAPDGLRRRRVVSIVNLPAG